MKQSEIFKRSEGDRWHERNKHKPHDPDPVMESILDLDFGPRTVLEIGCGNGWRLQNIKRLLGAVCYGIEPSKAALKEVETKRSVQFWRGTADKIPMPDNSLDMVIYGFCLYVVDREDLARIVCESDRVLRDGGYVIIHDFFSNKPYARVYEHMPDMRSYKQNYGLLWLGNPVYRLLNQKITGEGDDRTVVTVLKKDLDGAYPLLGDAEIYPLMGEYEIWTA